MDENVIFLTRLSCHCKLVWKDREMPEIKVKALRDS